MDDRFLQVGIRPLPAPQTAKAKWYKGKPLLSFGVLGLIVLGCLFCDGFLSMDPAHMDLYHANAAPNAVFWFGTDTMGRDLFSMIWYGGRISLFIGLLATVISTATAILLGALSGLAPKWLDALLMRFTEIFLSIPGLPLVILLQAILGKANVWSLSFVIGITGWTGIAKVVRTEVRQLRGSEYVLASRSMGGGFFWILRKHLTPNFFSSILFMVVMNVRNAIVSESTLSFLGIGLPVETVSWGSMLALTENSLLSGSWWIVLIPGVFLVGTMLCLTSIGGYLRKNAGRAQSNL